MKVYIRYLIYNFLRSFIYVSLVFLSLVLVLNILTEIEFFKNLDVKTYFPVYVSLLNSPSLLFEMFPFIFLISTQFFFIEIYENKEIDTLRQFGMDNFSLLRFLILISFLFSIFIISVFYNFSSILKNEYLKIKNNFADDKKYLAVITKNGIWIKDNFDKETIIINADKIIDEFLINSSITKLDQNFRIKQNIIAEKINIKSKDWILHNVIINEPNNYSKKYLKTTLKSNFDSERINNLFSDLSSLTYFELLQLEKDYISIGYSVDEIEIQKHKFYSLPFLLTVMTIIATIIMIYNKFKNNLLLNLFIGIFFSVVVYYLGHFSNLLGENGRLPLILSVWFPIIILVSLSSIGVMRLNEK
jgi:lipopolysaccharide export system permease protein